MSECAAQGVFDLSSVHRVEMIIWQRRTMNAAPILMRIARALRESRLKAVMIGNAAAALQGAPVTTVDVDFLFRKTPANLRELKMVARPSDYS